MARWLRALGPQAQGTEFKSAAAVTEEAAGQLLPLSPAPSGTH